MREGRRAHAGVISGVGIRPAFDPDHIRLLKHGEGQAAQLALHG